MKRTKKHRGFIVWQGASALDGAPIVLVAVRGSKNKKTGALIQTYILRSDIAPLAALKTGEDVSICGNCIHRELKSCYVQVQNAPTGIYKAYLRGSYPALTPSEIQEQFAGELVRLGAYGDPAAVPFAVWSDALARAKDWTGYTHQWKRAEFQPFKRYCMASADNLAESIGAQSAGWRTFTVVPKGFSDHPAKSFLCPASEEAGRKLQCEDCLACSGTGQGRMASVFIPVHGVAFKQTRFNNLIQIGRVAA